jgi:DegV family protein with EDD domain
MFPDSNIRIFDTRSASLGQGLAVLEAARMIEAGQPLSAILDRLKTLRDRMQVAFVVDTLEFLAKGGRIGRAANLIGSMLDIKPVLRMVNGVVESHDRYRTRRRALEALSEIVLHDVEGKSGIMLGIIHSIAEAEAQKLADSLCARVTPDIFMISELGPAIGVHAGPGTIGVCWYAE